MKGKSFWTLSLLVSVFLLPPVLFAQEGNNPRDEKSVLLELGLLDRARSNKEIAHITPVTKEAEPPDTQLLVVAKVWLSGDQLMLELTAPLPDGSERIRLDADLRLGRLGETSCTLGKGVYDVDYSNSRFGVVNLASENISAHRRRRSRRELG